MTTTLLNGLNALYGPTMFLVAILVSVFMMKSGIGRSTNEAQANAIAALREELEVQKRRIDSLKEENRHQERVIRTVCEALQKKGITITIDGEIISIEGLESKRSTTIIRIQEEDEK